MLKKMQRLFYLVGFFFLLMAGCQDAVENNDKETADNETADNELVTVNEDYFKPIATMDNATVFLIDTTKSQITWRCENHKGLVDLNTGLIFVRKGEPVGAYVEGLTKSARDTSISYKLMQGTFNNVLQTADFFDSEHYPLLKFKTSNILKRDDQYVVDGEISVRNIIKPIQFKLFSFRKKDGQIAMESVEIPIDRTLFGMELNSRSFPEKAKDFIFSDTFFVRVVLFAEAIKKAG